MSQLIWKQPNVNILLYHIVCPAKYRKAVFTPEVDEKLKEICEEISLRHEIEFLEIGVDTDHVHFLVQSVPTYSPTKIVRTIKSSTAKEIFRQMSANLLCRGKSADTAEPEMNQSGKAPRSQ